MTKAKTYFPQVSIEIAKKAAEAEANGRAAAVLERSTKKSSNGNGMVKAKPSDGEGV